MALSLGTSGVVFASANSPFYEPEGRLHAFPHALLGKWHLMGVMLSAAGSDGLLFLPYLTGERTPHPDPLARGAFVGLTVRHSQPHLTRAVLEGVAFGLADSFELMKAAGLSAIRQVRVSGSGARSPLWRQILADALGSELVTVNTTEGAAYGAALLAGCEDRVSGNCARDGIDDAGCGRGGGLREGVWGLSGVVSSVEGNVCGVGVEEIPTKLWKTLGIAYDLKTQLLINSKRP